MTEIPSEENSLDRRAPEGNRPTPRSSNGDSRLLTSTRLLVSREAMAESNDTPVDDMPPDRLSLDPRSPYFDEALLSRGVGIKFNGQEKTSVIEYSISQGWIRVVAGKSRDRFGQPMTIKLQGKVEPYFEKPPQDEGEAGVASDK